MNEYKRYLPDEIQNDALHYAKALISLTQKNYNDTLYHLIRIKWNDISYKTDIAALEVICYYELQADEQLENRINSFSLFLDKNKKITPTLYQPYKQFINFVKRLWQIKNEHQYINPKENPKYATQINIAQLEKDIEQSNNTWLKQKIIELGEKQNQLLAQRKIK